MKKIILVVTLLLFCFLKLDIMAKDLNKNISYSIEFNKHGAILKDTENAAIIYLGKDGDAYSKTKDLKSWEYSKVDKKITVYNSSNVDKTYNIDLNYVKNFLKVKDTNEVIPLEEGFYYNGKKEGLWKFYAYDRESDRVETLKERGFDLTSKSKLGQELKLGRLYLLEEGTYHQGKKEGLWRKYNPDTWSGRIIVSEEGNYKNGELLKLEGSTFIDGTFRKVFYKKGKILNGILCKQYLEEKEGKFYYNGLLYTGYSYTLGAYLDGYHLLATMNSIEKIKNGTIVENSEKFANYSITSNQDSDKPSLVDQLEVMTLDEFYESVK